MKKHLIKRKPHKFQYSTFPMLCKTPLVILGWEWIDLRKAVSIIETAFLI